MTERRVPSPDSNPRPLAGQFLKLGVDPDSPMRDARMRETGAHLRNVTLSRLIKLSPGGRDPCFHRQAQYGWPPREDEWLWAFGLAGPQRVLPSVQAPRASRPHTERGYTRRQRQPDGPLTWFRIASTI